MIICVCRNISHKEIEQCCRHGMGFDELQFELGVAVQCGAYSEAVYEIIKKINNDHSSRQIETSDSY